MGIGVGFRRTGLALALACAAAAGITACEAVLGLGDLGDRPGDGGGGSDGTVGLDAAPDAGSDAISSDGPSADHATGADASSDAGSDGPGVPEGSVETGADAASDGGGGVDGGGSDAATDAGSECGVLPTLHPMDAGVLYCGLTDAGTNYECPPGQECCFGGALGGGQFAPNVCAASGSVCTNGGQADAGGFPAAPIECNQIVDCIAGGNAAATACCLQGATNITVPGCFPKYGQGTGVVCEGTGGGAPTHCPAGEIQVCTSQADCPTGTQCTAAKWKIFQIGVCL